MTLPKDGIKKIRITKPLIHQITNYVTVNDCANVTLAIGASPIMADEYDEVSEITMQSQALLINIGTLSSRTILSMIRSGKTANELGIPIILDTVGVGVSKLRRDTCKKLIECLHLSVIKGNASEIRYFADGFSQGKGVDVSESEEENTDELILLSRTLANKFGCTIVCTGKKDIITNGNELAVVSNGVSMMKNITGTGCMSSALIASFLGVYPNEAFHASLLGMIVMGISGELAYQSTKDYGTSSFRISLIDNISKMTDEKLLKWGEVDEAK